jgi:glycosyltransferase involved in cell wall biosynthesis
MALQQRIPRLALVLPCYNEEAIIAQTVAKLEELLNGFIDENRIAGNSFMVFVDDGSRDRSLEILTNVSSEKVRIVKMSANYGHQTALLAGMHYVAGKVDCMVSLDADLQDDLNCIGQMLNEYLAGAHIVYGVRNDRSSDSFFKRKTAQWYYKLMQKMGVNMIYNHADFRLLSNTILQELSKYQEVNLFLRGIFPRMGFKSAIVYYSRLERTAGETKYPFRKMLNLAINGITSFSDVPLKLISMVGFIVFLGSVIASLWVLFVLLTGRNLPGWASITLPIYFIGGVQLLSLGVLGSYISRIYMETKKRPLYHVEQVFGERD